MRNKILAFTGHRPQSLPIDCWYITNEGSKMIAEKLYPFLKFFLQKHQVRHFISGGALGFDQIAFWTVEKLKNEYPNVNIINEVAVPFANQSSKWTDYEQLNWYTKMLRKAEEVVYVDQFQQYQIALTVEGEYDINKLDQRNYYMVDKSDIVCALWNGKPSGTGKTVLYAEHQGREIWKMNPKEDFKIDLYRKENRK